MTDLDALLDEATPAFEDVRICLDGARRAEWNALAEQAMAKDDAGGRLGAKSPAAVAKAKLDALADELRERMLTIRVLALPGTQWAALKGKNAPRKGDKYDEQNGFNIEAVARQALITHGKRVNGDKVEDITAGQWAKIFEKIGGGDFQTLIFAVVGVNQLAGQMFVSQLVKGSPATSNSAGK